MKTYIAIDGGTTNTRISLVRDRKVIDVIKLGIGARASIGNKELYINEIKAGILKLLGQNMLTEEDVVCILASGMITSEFGLCNLSHISVPAGIEELHNSMEKTVLEDISAIPFAFIRGVKTLCEDVADADVMRGEETELMGILSDEYGDCIYVLPGSHSKIIKVDENGKITDFSTMLTGEMIATLSCQTILKDAVDLNASIHNDYLIKGYECAKEQGINKALFKTRILKNIFGCTSDQTYSFFMGVVLGDEIDYIISCDAKTVVLGGRVQIKNAMAQILKNKCDKNIVTLDEKTINDCTTIGAVRIFENTI